MNNSKQNSQPPATKATSPLEKKFREGVKLIMEHWPALSIAVENGWASKYKRKYANDLPRNERFKTDEEYRAQFVDEICKFVLDFTVSEQDIESYLLDYVEDNYFMQLEDESEKDIAKYIHQLFESLSKNDDSILIQIREYAEKMGKQAQTIVSKASKGQKGYKDDDEWDDDEEEKNKDDGDQPPKLRSVQPKEASADTEPKSEAPKEDDKPIVDADGFITVTTRRKKKPAAENTEKTA